MNGNIKKNKYFIENFYFLKHKIKEYDQFLNEEKIENMFLDIKSNKIPLAEILNEIKDINIIIDENSHNAYIIELKKYNIKIYIISIDKIKFSFIIDSIICINIFRNALKVEKTENDFIEIIHIKQFYYISQKYNNFIFFCKICNLSSANNNFQFLFLHQNEYGLHQLFLNEIQFNILREENLQNLGKKQSFLNKKFNSTIQFEHNFKYYFNYNTMKEKFIIRIIYLKKKNNFKFLMTIKVLEIY